VSSFSQKLRCNYLISTQQRLTNFSLVSLNVQFLVRKQAQIQRDRVCSKFIIMSPGAGTTITRRGRDI